jgi:serine/threonine protein kinase
MGVIYAATDPLIGRPVAIKTIRLSSLDSGNNREELTRRLFREAQSAGILTHPGIITIHDVGEQGEDAYIVMEFVSGKSLEEVLDSGVPQHSDTYISLLKQVATALDYAHSKGIIHRDIKPSNIMICEDGTVKVADFGVAKLTASESMTQAGLVLGTPSYMSPEQAQGRMVDGSSDQFSLAVVAYRILTGGLPFVASTLTALLAKILWEEPDYQSAGLPPSLLAVFKKALSKDPKLRYGSCAEFLQQLEAAFSEQKSQPIPNTRASQSDRGADQQASNAPKRRKTVLIACAVCLAAMALGAGVFLAIRASQKLEPPVQPQTSSLAAIPRSEPPAAANRPLEPIADKPTIQMIAPAQPATPPPETPKPAVPQPGTRKSDAVKPLSQKTPAPQVEKVGNRAKSSSPGSGTIVWSGDLQKNSVLVIDDQQVSIGSTTGVLPGKPVQIEVEPRDVVIRQMPNAANAWKLIILYSGNRKYSSITISWKVLD